MTIKRPFSISGVGKYLPENIVTSAEIEEEIQLPKGWIQKRLGVNTRRKVIDETNTFMGVEALKEALNDAHLSIKDIDCLIGASATFDYVIPNRSSLIKHAFSQARNLDFPCIDINTVCTSFISALDYATILLSTGEYENIAIVSAEIASKGLDPANAEPYSLFGDAAAAIIISKRSDEVGFVKYGLKTYSQHAMSTIIKGGGNAFHPKDYPYESALYSFQMQGAKLLRAANKHMNEYLNSFFDKTTGTMSDVDWIVPHQASKAGHKLLVSINGNREDNISNQLSEFGNCIAASIPLALVSSIKSGELKDGDSCLLIGTAAGMSISTLLFKYSSR